MRFTSGTFAATLTLCISTFLGTIMADESVQLDVLRGGSKQAREIQEKWKEIREAAPESSNVVVKLQSILLPLSEEDPRVFLVWSGVERNVPPSQLVEQLHQFAKPDASIALAHTEFSPKNWDKIHEDDVLELRTYIITDENLPAIHARFRDHTMELFERHGMKNVEYYQLYSDELASVGDLMQSFAPLRQETVGIDSSTKASDKTLIYFLAHQSQEVGLASFAAFRSDPDWIQARTASEEKAGGSLTVANGVKSLYLKQFK